MKSFSKTSSMAVIMAVLFAGSPLAAQADYVVPHIQHAPMGTVKMVIPITSPDSKVWTFKMRNIGNSERGIREWHGKLEARIVLYGPGLKLLLDPSPQIQATVDQLRADGIRFDICNNTLKAMNLDWHRLYGVQEEDIVPAGFLEVGWLGNHGWAVNPMN